MLIKRCYNVVFDLVVEFKELVTVFELFWHVQSYLDIEENLKVFVYQDRKTPKR